MTCGFRAGETSILFGFSSTELPHSFAWLGYYTKSLPQLELLPSISTHSKITSSFSDINPSASFDSWMSIRWTFALVTVYFALGTIVSAYGCQLSAEKPASEKVKGTGNLKSHYAQEEIQQKLRFWGYLMQTTYLTCAGAVMLTDLVFWCILLPFLLGEQFSLTLGDGLFEAEVHCNNDTSNVECFALYNAANQIESVLIGCLHSLNAVFLLLDAALNNLTCAGAVMLTDLVFWCILLPFLLGEQFSLTLLIGCLHSLNAVFLLLDAALNNLPFPWFGFAYFVLWSCLYVSFQWVLHACGFTWWPYPFLELRTPWAPVWYLCLALVHIPCYAIYAVLIKMKHSVLPGLFPRAFVLRSH
ncbi:hypothetical protein CJ030_MR8G012613 [Morella rubra]|uniref:Transmembrane protein n=1 Tax=Morella rubra TaxID=262757 RepID=A0A6A1UQW1_9ROSI|nr:hypothetical protein CJ030_MR8G012613 [Morella rubra]